MSESIWPAVHSERRSLATDLAGLSPAEWLTPSLCSEWTVADVLAHMVAAAKTTPVMFFARFAGSGFQFNRYTAKQVAAEGAGGPAATLAAFHAVEQRESAPPGPKDTWLGEMIVHGEDIRRPLGISHTYPLPMVTRTIEFYARSNAIIGGRAGVKGLTLTATDADFTHGSGPVVEGPALSLLLAAAGRTSVLDELSGAGVAELRDKR